MWWSNFECFKCEIIQKVTLGNVLEISPFLALTFTSSKFRNSSGNSLYLCSQADNIQTVPLTSMRFLRQIMVEYNELCQYCKIKEGQDLCFSFETKRNRLNMTLLWFWVMTLHWFWVSSGLQMESLYSLEEIHIYAHRHVCTCAHTIFWFKTSEMCKICVGVFQTGILQSHMKRGHFLKS